MSASSERDRNVQTGSMFLRSSHVYEGGQVSRAHQKKSSISTKSVWRNIKAYPKLGNPKKSMSTRRSFPKAQLETLAQASILHCSVVAHHPTTAGSTRISCPHTPVGGCIWLLMQYLHFAVLWDASCEIAPTVSGFGPASSLCLLFSVSAHGLSSQLQH